MHSLTTHAVNFASGYMFCQNKYLELVLKIIGQYLKVERGRGVFLSPLPELQIYLFPDADFYAMDGHEDATDA